MIPGFVTAAAPSGLFCMLLTASLCLLRCRSASWLHFFQTPCFRYVVAFRVRVTFACSLFVSGSATAFSSLGSSPAFSLRFTSSVSVSGLFMLLSCLGLLCFFVSRHASVLGFSHMVPRFLFRLLVPFIISCYSLSFPAAFLFVAPSSSSRPLPPRLPSRSVCSVPLQLTFWLSLDRSPLAYCFFMGSCSRLRLPPPALRFCPRFPSWWGTAFHFLGFSGLRFVLPFLLRFPRLLPSGCSTPSVSAPSWMVIPLHGSFAFGFVLSVFYTLSPPCLLWSVT